MEQATQAVRTMAPATRAERIAADASKGASARRTAGCGVVQRCGMWKPTMGAPAMMAPLDCAARRSAIGARARCGRTRSVDAVRRALTRTLSAAWLKPHAH